VRLQLDQRVVMNHYRAGDLLRIPGLGPCKLRWSRKPLGVPKMVTLRRDAAGRYWVSMAIEEALPAPPASSQTVGIDLGTHHLAVLSTGEALDNPRHGNRYAERLHRLQRRLARQCPGSHRGAVTKQRIARLHARIADCRREHLHCLTTRRIRDNQTICLEDLHKRGMSASARGTPDRPGKRVRQKAGLNRSLLDAAFGAFARQLEYKAAWYGRTLIKVDRFYPSSKTCSACGLRRDELRLDVRHWRCPKCGAEHDRDHNAACNIEREGLRQLQHPEDTGEVRAFGGEGACPVAVSARIAQAPSLGREPG